MYRLHLKDYFFNTERFDGAKSETKIKNQFAILASDFIS